MAAILRSSAVTTRALRSRDALHAYAALETGDAAIITEFLNSQFGDTVSFYDAHESFCHGFLLSTCANWRVSINAETRKGRSDIIVERKDRKIGFVVEVKDVKDGGKLEHACEAAMKQIEEKAMPQFCAGIARRKSGRMGSPSGIRNAGWQRRVSDGKEGAQLGICLPQKMKTRKKALEY